MDNLVPLSQEEEKLLHVTTSLSNCGFYEEVSILVQLNKRFYADEQIWDGFGKHRHLGHHRRTHIMYSSMKGDIPRLTWLLKRGSRSDMVNKCSDSLTDGVTALMLAAGRGHTDAVELLCESGANVNAKRSTDGKTALMDACWAGHLPVVKVLLKFKAALTPLTPITRVTALQLAVFQGHTDIIELLQSLLMPM